MTIIHQGYNFLQHNSFRWRSSLLLAWFQLRRGMLWFSGIGLYYVPCRRIFAGTMKNIRLLSIDELAHLLRELGFKKQWAVVLYQYLWYQHSTDFREMARLPPELREQLCAGFFIPRTLIQTIQHSEDGTVKCALKLFDHYIIESVLIPTTNRVTVCVSSQVGCSLSCTFCATGTMERKRNVTFDEIVDQVVLMNTLSVEKYNMPVSNVVFMGMGEPLLNYSNVLASLEKLTDQKGLSIAPKRITISTAGVSKMIKRLGEEGLKMNLALSLHAANDEKRNHIMAINETNNLAELAEALNYFYTKSKNEITLEYILLSGFNDRIQDADDLIAFYKKVPVRLINILEYNTIENGLYQKPAEETITLFMRHLHAQNINAHLRRSRGKDIDAACGQLANIG